MLKIKTTTTTFSVTQRDPAHYETVKTPEQKVKKKNKKKKKTKKKTKKNKKTLNNIWANFKQTSLDSSLDVQCNGLRSTLHRIHHYVPVLRHFNMNIKS